MECRECLERLYPYLDKELSEADIAIVQKHLDDCRGCARHFVFEAKLIRRVHDACADEKAPDQLRERIILRLREG